MNTLYHYKIKYFKEHLDQCSVNNCQNCDVVCVFVNDIVDSEIIQSLKKNQIKLIALRCAGYNNIDLSAISNKINVIRVPGYSPHAVAEHAIALILTLTRKTHWAYHRTRDNNFSICGLNGFDLNGKTAGILGVGKIGKIAAEILKSFGMRILIYNHNHDDLEFAKKMDAEYVELNELYKQSDIISLHCPLTEETHHIINNESIEKMKTGVMLINTSRGGVIETEALIKGLKMGKIGFAGLDVYEAESKYFFEDYSITNVNDDKLARLISFNNVLITSHQGFFTNEALLNIAETTMKNIKTYFDGGQITGGACLYHNKKK